MFSNFLQDKHSNLHFEGFAFFIFVFLMARIILFSKF